MELLEYFTYTEAAKEAPFMGVVGLLILVLAFALVRLAVATSRSRAETRKPEERPERWRKAA